VTDRARDDRLAEHRSRVAAARTSHAPARGTAQPAVAPGVRECIDTLLDDGSFVEIGTLAHSDQPAHADSTPGDGKVGGHGRIDGRPVTIVADNPMIKRASTATVGAAKVQRLYEQAERAGNPFIYLGQTGGARIPDALGARGHSRLDPMAYLSRRSRSVPLVTAIIGESFGGSSLVSALSDLTIQLRGSCLAITSPLVISEATGEEPTFEDLGGVDIHAERTGQIDLVAESFDEVADQIRRFLGFLPGNSWSDPAGSVSVETDADPGMRDLVPANPRTAYDMRAVVRRLVDGGDFLELRRRIGTGVLTGLAAIGGASVGVVASQPMRVAGAITPDACDKIVRLLCTCDAYGLPVVILQDTPGFLVGTGVEHDGLLYKAMLLHQAVVLASVPVLAVIVRKSYGLATACLGGAGMGTDTILAWPDARLGFMDPTVAVRVLYRRELDALDRADRDADVAQRAEQLAQDNSVYAAAGVMRVDEVIDPADTRIAVSRRLSVLTGRRTRDRRSILASWPTAW